MAVVCPGGWWDGRWLGSDGNPRWEHANLGRECVPLNPLFDVGGNLQCVPIRIHPYTVGCANGPDEGIFGRCRKPLADDTEF